MLLGSSEVGMIPPRTTAKTSRDHVMILTEEPCLCTSSTLTKFQVMVTAGFGCGTPMLVLALLGSAILGSASLAGVGHTGVGLTGVPLLPAAGVSLPPFLLKIILNLALTSLRLRALTIMPQQLPCVTAKHTRRRSTAVRCIESRLSQARRPRQDGRLHTASPTPSRSAASS